MCCFCALKYLHWEQTCLHSTWVYRACFFHLLRPSGAFFKLEDRKCCCKAVSYRNQRPPSQVELITVLFQPSPVIRQSEATASGGRYLKVVQCVGGQSSMCQAACPAYVPCLGWWVGWSEAPLPAHLGLVLDTILCRWPETNGDTPRPLKPFLQSQLISHHLSSNTSCPGTCLLPHTLDSCLPDPAVDTWPSLDSGLTLLYSSHSIQFPPCSLQLKAIRCRQVLMFIFPGLNCHTGC